MSEFDKQRFSLLMQRAMGNRKMSEYAMHTGISLTYVSELIRGLRDKPPMPPTIRKLANKAYNGVTYNDLMEAAGHSEDNLISNSTSVKSIPLLGSIRTGIPNTAFQDIQEWLNIDRGLDADFALTVKDNSMIGAGIHEGDIAICKQACTAEQGQMVVALINGNETTLKYLVEENGYYLLRAANRKYADIILRDDDNMLQGIVLMVQKKPICPEVAFAKASYLQDVNEKWQKVAKEAAKYNVSPDIAEILIRSFGKLRNGDLQEED